jgi:hypothetical protein
MRSGKYLGQGRGDLTSQQTVTDSGHNIIVMTCLRKHHLIFVQGPFGVHTSYSPILDLPRAANDRIH